ncbi:hypothetical protein GCM10010191_49450 [Actinomadura vinacea]|uniref:Transposase Helix-turn-helix domain-containing protein n=1 Tax=Actinomadura vinacea TaxID=115336 RepID=A0ABN3JJM1_9ACTN
MLPPERQALLVLVHLRRNETFAALATAFGVGLATAHRNVTVYEPPVLSSYGSVGALWWLITLSTPASASAAVVSIAVIRPRPILLSTITAYATSSMS